jgi:hypothetical protein
MALAAEVLTGLVGVDVLPLILEDLYSIGCRKSDVLNVALACKSFCEPALDILWRDLDDLEPLLSLLPLSEFDDDGISVSLGSMSRIVLTKNTSTFWSQPSLTTARVGSTTIALEFALSRPSARDTASRSTLGSLSFWEQPIFFHPSRIYALTRTAQWEPSFMYSSPPHSAAFP